MTDNQLYYGDNLEVLAKLPSESVDLVYLDPPFNSARNYNVIFARTGDTPSDAGAQIHAFEDTWTWTQGTQDQYDEYVGGAVPNAVAEALTAFNILIGQNDALAYLVNMAPRLVELHRVLKSTGSLFLHCDPTMSHYLKVLLDSIFDPRNFRNEIIWKRATTVKGNFGQGQKAFGANTDTILYYQKTKDAKYNQLFTAYSDEYVKTAYKYVEPGTDRRYRLISMIGPGGAAKGNPQYEVLGVTRYWRYSKKKMSDLIDADMVVQTKPGTVPNRKLYLDEGKGVPVQSLWDDIPNLQAASAEALGYPTQKPLSLLRRIIETATDVDDVILDPFCGCGTAVDAAQALDRKWVGIDITYIAVDLIEKRLQHTYGDAIKNEYTVAGIPKDSAAAQALFLKNPFDFERWAVSQVGAQPNAKQVGDKGIDGVARFPIDSKTTGRVLVSVKGGKTINPSMARDLEGTLAQQKAELGVLIVQSPVTKGIQEVADKSGSYKHPNTGQSYPRIQVITVAELLAGKLPNMPGTYLPYIAAAKAPSATGKATLF
ncbi:DNA methyltransferase [Cryobacterium sp. TMT3-29-2]|uniref:DNA methyltransferase n=1 Tax=Cryobacterium sp. TMT3-29-2 TaxID=2555867 RepID=UPI001073B659|nr:DNA methyltransferase [Cryobacterium sp. TMT3-29-2]TFC84498.1 restriction endonuclease subunit M [Cryobacterium sp. TMT3-29-2]